MSFLNWRSCDLTSKVPDYAVQAGRDDQGNSVYVARAFHNNGMIPGAVIPQIRKCTIANNNAEHEKQVFEILCGTIYRWESSSHGQVPPKAFLGGHAVNGEQLYIGRVIHKSSQISGKVHPSNRCMYIAYEGKELKFTENYEILLKEK